jgi:hypothetical protein
MDVEIKTVIPISQITLLLYHLLKAISFTILKLSSMNLLSSYLIISTHKTQKL